jgi:hypothetical protein
MSPIQTGHAKYPLFASAGSQTGVLIVPSWDQFVPFRPISQRVASRWKPFFMTFKSNLLLCLRHESFERSSFKKVFVVLMKFEATQGKAYLTSGLEKIEFSGVASRTFTSFSFHIHRMTAGVL